MGSCEKYMQNESLRAPAKGGLGSLKAPAKGSLGSAHVNTACVTSCMRVAHGCTAALATWLQRLRDCWLHDCNGCVTFGHVAALLRG